MITIAGLADSLFKISKTRVLVQTLIPQSNINQIKRFMDQKLAHSKLKTVLSFETKDFVLHLAREANFSWFTLKV